MTLADLRAARSRLYRRYQQGLCTRDEYTVLARLALRDVNKELMLRGGATTDQIKKLLGNEEHRQPCPVCGKAPPPDQVWANYAGHVRRCAERKGLLTG